MSPPMVSFPFYSHPQVSDDGWRCAFVLDAGETGGKATLYLYARLQAVKVSADVLRTKAKPVEYGVRRTREYMERLIATYLRNGLSFDRRGTVKALEVLGMPKRVAEMIERAPKQVKVDPRSIKEDSDFLTREEAAEINAELRMMLRALGLKEAEDRRAKRLADIQANGQMQFAIKAAVARPAADRRSKPKMPARPVAPAAAAQATLF